MHYGTFRQSLFALALLGGIACAQSWIRYHGGLRWVLLVGGRESR